VTVILICSLCATPRQEIGERLAGRVPAELNWWEESTSTASWIGDPGHCAPRRAARETGNEHVEHTKREKCLMRLSIALVALCLTGAHATEPTDLQTCIAEVVENDPAMGKAAASVRAARTGVLASKAGWLPDLSVTAGYTRTESEESSGSSWVDSLYGLLDESESVRHSYTLGASASMPVWRGGYNWANLRYSRSTAREREWQLAETQLFAELTAVELYYGVLRAEHLLRVGEQTEALAAEHLERAEQLHAVGAVPLSDVLKARVSLSQSRLATLTLEKALRVARSQITSAMGLGPLEDIEVVDDLADPDPPPGPEEGFLAEARDNRPLLVAAHEAETSASAGIGMARSSGLPHVDLRASYAWSDEDPNYDDGFLARENYQWSAGVQISVPLFDRFSTKEGVAQARASLQSAVWETERVRRQVDLEVHQAYLEMEEARMKLSTAEQTVEEAHEALRLAEERYRLGAGTSLETLDAQARLSEAETSRIEALYEIKLASARMRRAVGKGQRHGDG
jgi:outer membrane protein TolC